MANEIIMQGLTTESDAAAAAVVDEMFVSETSDDVMGAMAKLAEEIAIEDEAIKALDSEVIQRKAALDEAKRQQYELMVANNCANGHKFDNGILLAPVLKINVFKAAGVSDDQQQNWLKQHGLGDIIKPTVNWNTFSSTMKAWVAQGNNLPEIFNVVEKPTVIFRGPGKKQFLVNRAATPSA